MRIQRFLFFLVAFIFLVANCNFLAAQADADSPDKLYRPINSDLMGRSWPAQWITCPDAAERDPVVFHFRKVVGLLKPPQHFLVHVSADNQFLLYVNQKRVGSGPAHPGLEVVVGHTYPLEQAPRAHIDLRERRTTGKLLLDPTV